MLSHSVLLTDKGRKENIVRRSLKKMLCQKQLISELLAVVTQPDEKIEGCDFSVFSEVNVAEHIQFRRIPK